MRDFAQKWTAFPEWSEAELLRDGWRARVVPGLSQTLVSGALDKAWAQLGPEGAEVGLWQIASPETPYRVRIARDRALLVSPEAMAFDPGWHADGWAATVADNSYAVLELEGSETRNVVSEATTADLDAGSPSAATLFAGLQSVLLYRTAEARVRLHVESGYLPYLWRWLETRPE
ncbi:hypothetical protein [Aquibaculum arenosum]|uniref:Uncharacterized protein n=1 Tax=Aquibaculum arenosum TaxID=3032591 RepID=A0ABT5YJG8_9PROT|nr:hypothetical protein [Fodinicurvata sp. CAU 1616]MDF2095048.1 hypothetical protein [Fodinicurvata sp. CAU 1616]